MLSAYFHFSNLQSIRIRFYLLGALVLGLLTLLSLYEGKTPDVFVELAVGVMLLVTIGVLRISNACVQEIHWIEVLNLFCTMGVGIWAICLNKSMSYLIFAIPAYVHILFAFKKANIIVALFSLMVLYVTQKSQFSDNIFQIVFAYFSSVMLVTIFAYMSEIHNQFLRKILNMDQTISAYNELQLETDLGKEIPRADRQGSLLAYILVRFKYSDSEITEVNRMAKSINQSVRLSDSLYLIKPDRFVVLLAGGEQSDVQNVLAEVQSQLGASCTLNYQLSLHSYNQEDDVESLIQKMRGNLNAV